MQEEENYCHINPKGDVEPCVFIHYSGANIREKSLLECLKQPLFMAYRDNQPFNDNMLRPCPIKTEIFSVWYMTGAKSTDMQQPETVERMQENASTMQKSGKEQQIWAAHPYRQRGYTNFKRNRGESLRSMQRR